MYYEYIEKHPPVSWLVAAYVGVKPKAKKQNDRGSMDDLLAMFGGPGKIR